MKYGNEGKIGRQEYQYYNRDNYRIMTHTTTGGHVDRICWCVGARIGFWAMWGVEPQINVIVMNKKYLTIEPLNKPALLDCHLLVHFQYIYKLIATY